MKTLRQTILAFAVTVGLAFSVVAQGDDQKKPPKNPPVVDPGKKPPRGNPPKGEKPGKPGSAYYLV